MVSNLKEWRLMTTQLFAATLVTFLATALGSAQEKRMTDNPGAEHGGLMKLAGEYSTVSKFKLNANDAGQLSNGVSKLTRILDGRFLLEEANGAQFNQPFMARKVYGYNNAAKRYESSWIYTGSTSMLTLSGTSSDGGKTIQFEGGYDQANGAKSNLVVFFKRLSDDKFVVELVLKTPGGGTGPSLETTYTKK